MDFNNRIVIFSSVMARLLEPHSSYIYKALNSLETDCSEKENIEKMDKLFMKFPRSNRLYKDTIQQLCALSSSDVDGTIHFLTKLIKEILNGSPTSQFTLIQMVMSFYDLQNRKHYVIHFYYSLFLFTDIISQIVVRYNTQITESITFLTRTAYNISIAKHTLPKTALKILRQWSIIFSILSERCFSAISQIFSMFSNAPDLTFALTLIRFLRFDLNDQVQSFVFFEQVIQTVKNHIRKKTITNDSLEAMADMLVVTFPFYSSISPNSSNISNHSSSLNSSNSLNSPNSSIIINDNNNNNNNNNNSGNNKLMNNNSPNSKEEDKIISKLYQLIRPLSYDKNLWSGAVLLKTCLFIRLPSNNVKRFKKSHFIQKQILGSASDDRKLAVSLRCFELLIIGRNADPNSEIWEWGPDLQSRKFAYLMMNSAPEITQNDPKSFTNIFMSSFFVKADFSLCPKLIKKILLHLASLDFQYFSSSVVPKFLELESLTDPRFVSLLMIVPNINSNNFWDNLYKKYTSDIKTELLMFFNKSLKNKVLDSLRFCTSQNNINNLNNMYYKHGIKENKDNKDNKKYMMNNLLNISNSISNLYSIIKPNKESRENLSANIDGNNENLNDYNDKNRNINEHCLCFGDFDIMMDSMVFEADQKMSQILDEWKMKNSFQQNKCEYKRSENPENKFSLPRKLMPALKYVLDEDDFNNPILMDVVIELSYNRDKIVSSTAYDICKNILPKLPNQENYLQMLMVTITTYESNESVFTCLSLIESALHLNSSKNDSSNTNQNRNGNLCDGDNMFSYLKSINPIFKKNCNDFYSANNTNSSNSNYTSSSNSNNANNNGIKNKAKNDNEGLYSDESYDSENDFIENDNHFDQKNKIKNNNSSDHQVKNNENQLQTSILLDLEVIAFLGISSSHPYARHLCLLILKKINELLDDKGLLSFIIKQIPMIERQAKDIILLKTYPDLAESNESSRPSSNILFETAILSHYHEIWWYFVSEMCKVVINMKYVPFFQRLSNLQNSLTQKIVNDNKSLKKSDFCVLMILLSSMWTPKSKNKIKDKNDSNKNLHANKNSNDFNYNFNNNNSINEIKNIYNEAYNINNANNINDNNTFINYKHNGNCDKRKEVCFIIDILLNNENEEIPKTILLGLPLLHRSFLGILIDVISNLKQTKYFPEACQTLCTILRLPDIEEDFIVHNFKRITKFINVINLYLLKNNLNSPRIMKWDEASEKKLIGISNFITSYSMMIYLTFKEVDLVNDADFAISTREVIFRFLVNWAITTDENLTRLRQYSKIALSTLVRSGQLFTDSLLFDDTAAEFLGQMDISGARILRDLLKYHLDILLHLYIRACFTQTPSIADAYFNAICKCLKSNASNSNAIIKQSGELLLLLQIFILHDHPKAFCFINRLIDIAINHEMISIENNEIIRNKIQELTNSYSTNISALNIYPNSPSNPYLLSASNKKSSNSSLQSLQMNIMPTNTFGFNIIQLIPQIFTYATEAVFVAFFNLIKLENLAVPFGDIINSVRTWIKIIRLLPKQTSLISNLVIPPQFNYFTPYEFLVEMIKTTENVNDHCFRDLAGLWADMVQNPDHRELIPIFMTSMINSEYVKRLFSFLLTVAPMNIISRVDERTSFACYYHMTKCCGETNTLNSDWIGSLLKVVFNRYWEDILVVLPIAIQFVFLFRDEGSNLPFKYICKKLKIDVPSDNEMKDVNILRGVIEQIVHWLSSVQKVSIEKWGNEALKWLFACDETRIAAESFMVYNVISIPYDEKTMKIQVIKTVYYHIEKVNYLLSLLINDNKNDNQSVVNEKKKVLISSLSLLITESFNFFNRRSSTINDHLFISNYMMSFLDCQIIMEIDLSEAIEFFMKITKQPDLLLMIGRNLISFIRPFIPHLENSKVAQDLIDIVIELLKSEDVMMIAAPIKKSFPNLFPHMPKFEDFISDITDNAMCTSLIHYAMISETASKTVLNSIFEISAMIVNRIVNENNKSPLTRLYQQALRTINKCPAAFDFIRVLFEKQPQATIYNNNDLLNKNDSTNDIYYGMGIEWNRSLEDVSRSVKQILKNYSCINEEKAKNGKNYLPSSSSNLSLQQNNIDNFSNKDSNNNCNINCNRKCNNNDSNNINNNNSNNDSFVDSSDNNNNNCLITDCKHFTSVLNFLYIDDTIIKDNKNQKANEQNKEIDNENDSINFYNIKEIKLIDNNIDNNANKFKFLRPKILPFASQTEMIEGMKNIKTKRRRKTKENNRNKKIIPSLSSKTIPNSVSFVFSADISDKNRLADLKPLHHPKKLILEPKSLEEGRNVKIKINFNEFLKESRRKSSSSGVLQ